MAVLMLNPIGCTIFGIFLGIAHTRKAESAMRKPSVYEPIGKALALYCQSDQSLFPEYMGYAWLPDELNAIRHGTASVSTNYAHVEMGGGFHHFGYHLVHDANASSPRTNAWQLYMYSEGSSDRFLKTFFLHSGQRVPADELLAKVIAGFDKQILGTPQDELAHRGKIQTYLRFDRVKEARDACRSMLQALPDEWWAVLINALINAQEVSSAEGEKDIAKWVEKERNFFRYMDLAYFHQLTDRKSVV